MSTRSFETPAGAGADVAVEAVRLRWCVGVAAGRLGLLLVGCGVLGPACGAELSAPPQPDSRTAHTTAVAAGRRGLTAATLPATRGPTRSSAHGELAPHGHSRLVEVRAPPGREHLHELEPTAVAGQRVDRRAVGAGIVRP